MAGKERIMPEGTNIPEQPGQTPEAGQTPNQQEQLPGQAQSLGIHSSVETVRQLGYIAPPLIGQVPESAKAMSEVVNQLVGPDERSERLEKIRTENIWSPEFRKLGIDIATLIIDKEKDDYQNKYSDNGKKLEEYYEAWKEWVARKGEQARTRKPAGEPKEEVQEDLLDGLSPLTTLYQRYNELEQLKEESPLTPEQSEELNQTKSGLSRYFKEAKRRNLLAGIEANLNSLSGSIIDKLADGASPDDLNNVIASNLQRILDQHKQIISRLRRTDPGIAKFAGLSEAYKELAAERLDNLVNNLPQQLTIIEGEFNFESTADEAFEALSQSKEVYWKPTYANYFEVNARTPEQFQVAVATFTQWLRSGLTKSPNDIFEKVRGFKDALTTAGVRQKETTTSSFMAGLRRELEALVGVLGANHANEHYNTDYYKQFLTFAAQDEGPERFVRLSRANRGKVAAVLSKLDGDPRFELYFSPHGSRGQLARERNPIEQEELQKHIEQILITEVMGIDIKEYVPDPKNDNQVVSIEAREANLDEIANTQSDEQLKELFEGFGGLDQQRVEYDSLKNKTEDQLKPGEKKLRDRLKKIIPIQEKVQNGLNLEKDEQAIYDEAKSAVDLALELYGVMGEKAKRGGGAVFLVDKLNPDRSFRLDAEGNPIVDYVPIHWAEKFVQFAENWTKAEYGDRPAAYLKKKVSQARKNAIATLKKDGFAARLSDVSFYLQEEIKDPKTIIVDRDKDGNPIGLKFGPGNKPEGFQFDPQTGKITIYDYENNLIEAENVNNRLVYTKKQLIDFDSFWGLDQYKQPLFPDIVGYQNGKAVTFLTFDSNAPLFDRLNNEKNNQRRIYLDVSPMLLKRPKVGEDGEVIKSDGSVVVDGERGKGVPVDFRTAVNHIYSRWTGHPYWGYQEEDTGLLLAEEALEDAKLIKAGKKRPEDALPHAVQRLIVDPTLERVGHFPHHEGREDKIALAAVEDSYQSHWRITDELYKAFYSADADDEDNRIAYGLQDFGGSTKEWFHARAEAARWTDLKVRRLRTLIPVLPLHFTSMSEMWGAGSVLNVLRMMNYGTSTESSYRMIGQFALEKWIGQTEAAEDVYSALFGYVDAQGKRSREGLGEKPTNDADALQRWYEKLDHLVRRSDPKITSKDEGTDNQFLNAIRESLGRLDILFQRIRVLETDKRGERTPLWLEGIDIYKRSPDGKIKVVNGQRVFNTAIDKDRNTGSARHSGEVFFWRFVKWLKNEGAELYSTEAMYYGLMDEYTLASRRLARIGTSEEYDLKKLATRWEWLLGKINR